MTKKGIIFLLILFVSVAVYYQWNKSNEEKIFSKNIGIKETAIDKLPPIKPVKLDQSKKLLDQFEQNSTTNNDKYSQGKIIELFKENLKFKQGSLVKDEMLRQAFDQALLLHYEFGLGYLRYLMAKSLVLKFKNEELLVKYFMQVDEVFCRYVNLLRRLESFPNLKAGVLEYDTQLKRLQKIRREYLGEDLAKQFYAKEEVKLQNYFEHERLKK